MYKKSLSLSPKERQQRSTGAIVNHMATDAEQLQLICMGLHNLWSSPLRIGIGIYFLITQIVSFFLTPQDISTLFFPVPPKSTSCLILLSFIFFPLIIVLHFWGGFVRYTILA